MTEFQARFIEAVAFIAAILFAMAAQGCAALQVQATPQGMNATYIRIGDQDLSGLEVDRDKAGAWRVRIDSQKATGEAISDAVRAAMEAIP